MAGLLADVFSFGDTAKRKVKGLLADPVGTLQQFVGNENDRAGRLNELTYAAAAEQGMGPQSKKLAGLLADSYSPVAMVMPDKAKAQVLATIEGFAAGEKPRAKVPGGVILTNDQKNALNDAYSKLTNNTQPFNKSNALDVNAEHIYDSRVSGKVKPSGKVADSFAPQQVVDWLSSALDDSATVGVRGGVPHLQNNYVDPVTGASYVVRAPVSGNHGTGVQWVSGLIPEGVFSQPKSKKP